MKVGVVIRNMGTQATKQIIGGCAKAAEDAGFDCRVCG